MIRKIATAAERRPGTVILLVLTATAIASYGGTKISMTTELEEFLPKDYPSVKVTLEAENQLSLQLHEYVMIETENVLKANVIRTIHDLEELLREEPSLQGYLLSIESYPDYMGNLEAMTDEQIEATALSLSAHPEIGAYISENLGAARIIMRINPALPEEELQEKTGELHSLVEKFSGGRPDISIEVTGDLSLDRDLRGVMNRDNRVLIPAAVALVIVILFLTFRRLSDAAILFLILGIGATWVVGIFGYSGLKFTPVHVVTVPLILGVGVDYVIHVLNRYYEETGKGRSAKAAVATSIRTVGVAVLLAAITTMVGFGSFLVSDFPPIRTLGVLIMTGIFFSFVLSTTLLPAILVLRDRRKRPSRSGRRVGGEKIGILLSKIAAGTERHKGKILLVTVVLTAICIVSAFGISTTMSFELFMPEEISSVAASEKMSDYFGGRHPAVVLAEGDIASPQTLISMYTFEKSVLLDPRNLEENLIMDSYSIADLLYDAFAEAQMPAKLPTREQIAALIDNLKERKPQVVNSLLVDNKAMIYFYVRGETDREMKEAVEIIRSQIEESAEQELNMKIDGSPAVGGAPAIIADIVERIKSSSLRTTATALILCMVILALIFRSPSMGAIAILPAGLSFLWEFGALRGIGWPMDVLNMTVPALVIGIGVDFAVHISHRFREEREAHRRSPEESIRITVTNVGRALVAAAATTCGAFGILSLATMPAVNRFGLLSALVIFFALVAALVILPSVLITKDTKSPSRK